MPNNKKKCRHILKIQKNKDIWKREGGSEISKLLGVIHLEGWQNLPIDTHSYVQHTYISALWGC